MVNAVVEEALTEESGTKASVPPVLYPFSEWVCTQ